MKSIIVLNILWAYFTCHSMADELKKFIEREKIGIEGRSPHHPYVKLIKQIMSEKNREIALELALGHLLEENDNLLENSEFIKNRVVYQDISIVCLKSPRIDFIEKHLFGLFKSNHITKISRDTEGYFIRMKAIDLSMLGTLAGIENCNIKTVALIFEVAPN